MCYEVTCSSCGKASWGGCGRHVASVHRRISDGQHCQCKDWPGVAAKTGGQPSAAGAAASDPSAPKQHEEPAPSGGCTIV